MTSEWMRYDPNKLDTLRVTGRTAAALAGLGLPVDTYKMFFRNADRELEARELPEAGRSAFLGQYEDGVNTYWLSLADDSVWILRGYDDDPQQVGWVNSSVVALQKILEIWDGFIGSGVYEDNDRYDGLVAETIERAHEADPRAFEDEESWWSRVFEEIEYGVLAPE